MSSRGYVQIRVGREHHLADTHGNAYEHRLVAEQKIGRLLAPGEVVHHINGNKSDNRPENLQVMANNTAHQVAHRPPGCVRRLPGEENPTLLCECGCGTAFPKYDTDGSPRRFIHGHNYRFPNRRPYLRGDRHPAAKLTERDVIEVWRLYRGGISQAAIARQFHVSLSTINKIIKGKSWAHLADIAQGGQV